MVPKVQWDSTGSLNMLPLLAPRIRQNIFKTDFEATLSQMFCVLSMLNSRNTFSFFNKISYITDESTSNRPVF